MKTKLNALAKSYIINKKGEPILPDTGYRNNIFKIQQSLGCDLEFSYVIMRKACMIIVENCETDEDIRDIDSIKLSRDTASVWKVHRFSYLTIENEYDILSILHEYNCNISNACAIWYEEKVADAIDKIKEYMISAPEAISLPVFPQK